MASVFLLIMVKMCFLAPFTASSSLIRSHTNTAKRFKAGTPSCTVMSSGVAATAGNIGVTPSKLAQTSHAVLFPHPPRETVSQPVKYNMGNADYLCALMACAVSPSSWLHGTRPDTSLGWVHLTPLFGVLMICLSDSPGVIVSAR